MRYIIVSSTGIRLSLEEYVDLAEAAKEAAKLDTHYKIADITFYVEEVA